MNLSVIPIQSFSDIITNSSSEIFLMRENNASAYWYNDSGAQIELIDSRKWINNHYEYSDLFYDYLLMTIPEILQDESAIQSLVGLYVVEINDHCDNSEECFKQAREDSIAYVSRR